ncbi:hypothetical protein Lal_00035507 [Lupinus albus]|nr:hypothetical protein Lal_00035507 [Lupinus albus]
MAINQCRRMGMAGDVKITGVGNFVGTEIDMMKERFAKLLFGEDMSGCGKGVCTATAISNAITKLCGSDELELAQWKDIYIYGHGLLHSLTRFDSFYTNAALLELPNCMLPIL